MGPRMLQSFELPGTSTPRAMQGDGLIPQMTDMSHPRSLAGLSALAPRGLARSSRGFPLCRDRPPLRGAGRLHQRAIPEGLYLRPTRSTDPDRASQDHVLIVMGTPSTVATLDGEVLLHLPAQRASGRLHEHG